jgi:heme O synthase-like polyprenyltransferase
MKPGIAAGVAVAGLAGMTLAGRGLPGLGMGILCLLCILMAASGSAIINVVMEAGTDALMPRVAVRTRALYRVGGRLAVIISSVLSPRRS